MGSWECARIPWRTGFLVEFKQRVFETRVSCSGVGYLPATRTLWVALSAVISEDPTESTSFGLPQKRCGPRPCCRRGVVGMVWVLVQAMCTNFEVGTVCVSRRRYSLCAAPLSASTFFLVQMNAPENAAVIGILPSNIKMYGTLRISSLCRLQWSSGWKTCRAPKNKTKQNKTKRL